MPQEEIGIGQAREAVRWLDDFLDDDWLSSKLMRRARLQELYGRWVPPRVHRNQLVDLFAGYRHDYREHSNDVFERSRQARILLGHATNVRHVADQLTADDRRRLQCLLQRSKAVDGYLYQCAIAAHFARDGKKLLSFSVGGSDEADVQVEYRGAPVDLQCKAVEYGTGRKIPPRTFNDLAVRVIDLCERSGGFTRIDILIDERLDAGDRRSILEQIRKMMSARLNSEQKVLGYKISISFPSSPLEWDELRRARERELGRPFAAPHVCFLGWNRPDGRDELHALLRMISTKQDRVVSAIVNRAKRAASQLSKTNFGVVYVHIPEPIDWNAVKSSGGFERRVTELLRSEIGRRIGGIVFTSESLAGDLGYQAFHFLNAVADRPLPEGLTLAGPAITV